MNFPLTKYLAILLTVVAVAMLSGKAGASPAEPVLSEIVGKIQDRYDGITDLRADFLHRIPIALTGTTMSEQGVFSFKKPKKLRWEYSDPPGKLMVINPEVMWLYLPDDDKVYLQETEKALASQLAARFLTGLGQLDRDFHVSFAEPARDENGNYRIVLKPREAAGGLRNLILAIDEETFLIAGYTLTDLYGTTNSYFFSNVSLNGGLPDSLFLYDPPPGARVESLP